MAPRKSNNPSKSARNYAKNPASKAKKDAYNKEFNKKKSQRKKRSELVQERRDRGIYGSGGKDVAHTKNGTRMKSVKANRGNKTDMPGDKRARGCKKK